MKTIKSIIVISLLYVLSTSCNSHNTNVKNFVSDSEYDDYVNDIKIRSDLEKNCAVMQLGAIDTFYCPERDMYLKLSEISPQKDLLVFRFRNMNCMVCVDSVFAFINRSGINQNRVAVFCDIAAKPRGIKLFRDKYKFSGMILTTNGPVIKEIDQAGYPYLFVLQSNEVLCNLHIPNKYDYNKTLYYLQTVKTNLGLRTLEAKISIINNF